MAVPRIRLGDLLVEAQLITPQQLQEVLDKQKTDSRRLGTLLVESGLITETQVTQILSQQLAVPWVSLYHIDFSRQLLNLVPKQIVDHFCLVPIFVRRVRGLGQTLYVAMDDPTNEIALEAVRSHSDLPVRAMIAPPSDIRAAIRVYYDSGSASEASTTQVKARNLPALEEPPAAEPAPTPSQRPAPPPKPPQPPRPSERQLAALSEDERAEVAKADTTAEAAPISAHSKKTTLSIPPRTESATGERSGDYFLRENFSEAREMAPNLKPSEKITRKYGLGFTKFPEDHPEDFDIDVDLNTPEPPITSRSAEGAAAAAYAEEPTQSSEAHGNQPPFEQVPESVPSERTPVTTPALDPVDNTPHMPMTSFMLQAAAANPYIQSKRPSAPPPPAGQTPTSSRPSAPPPPESASEELSSPSSRAPESELPARAASMPKPPAGGRRMVSLTLLDGTTINLPARPKAKPAPVKVGAPEAEPLEEDQLTARDLIAALRAVSHGADATEILGENVRWEAMFAALLSLLLKKHLIADWEFVEEYKKI